MSATAGIPVGVSAEKAVTVTREMTVAHYHESMPEVFGTPVMIYHMEVTASEAVQPHLPEGWVSVGVAVNVRHLAATPVGMTVRFKAVATEVRSGMITFSVEAYDEKEKIGEGVHVRAAVEMSRFMKRVEAKARQTG